MTTSNYSAHGCTVARDKASVIARELARKGDWSPHAIRARNARLLAARNGPDQPEPKAGMVYYGPPKKAEMLLELERMAGNTAWIRQRVEAVSIEVAAGQPSMSRLFAGSATAEAAEEAEAESASDVEAAFNAIMAGSEPFA